MIRSLILLLILVFVISLGGVAQIPTYSDDDLFRAGVEAMGYSTLARCFGVLICEPPYRGFPFSMPHIWSPKLHEIALDYAGVLKRFPSCMSADSHKCGSDLKGRLEAGGYEYCVSRENIHMSWGHPLSGKFAAQNWIDSPGHYRNITSHDSWEMGVGVVQDNDKLYWVQIMTAPAGSC